MNAIKVALCAVALTALSAGCNRFTPAPEFRAVNLNPEQLKPGDVALITVQIEDSNNIVDRVVGVLEESPTVTFRLADDGQGGDEKANDDVWTLKVDVPFDAPAGQFMLKFTAYRSDGEVVMIKDDSGATVPMAASHPFAVQYAQETN